MTLHVDVTFTKENDQLKKKVYFTSVYRCEQGLIDNLCLVDVVLAKVKEDFPELKNLYAKSNNASPYHGNYYIEALYNLCKEKQLALLRYDYNEPSRRKDQCDRGSADVQNADVAVVSIDWKASILSGQKEKYGSIQM